MKYINILSLVVKDYSLWTSYHHAMTSRKLPIYIHFQWPIPIILSRVISSLYYRQSDIIGQAPLYTILYQLLQDCNYVHCTGNQQSFEQSNTISNSIVRRYTSLENSVKSGNFLHNNGWGSRAKVCQTLRNCKIVYFKISTRLEIQMSISYIPGGRSLVFVTYVDCDSI